MARIKLLKRVFKGTGRVLGTFPATVLEDFDKTFTDSDEAQEGPGEQGNTETQRVPDPPKNPVKDVDKEKSKNEQEEDEYQKQGMNPPGDEPPDGPRTFNRKGDDLDNENPVDPNQPENNPDDEEEYVGPKPDEEDPGNQGEGNNGNEGEEGNEGDGGSEGTPGEGSGDSEGNKGEEGNEGEETEGEEGEGGEETEGKEGKPKNKNNKDPYGPRGGGQKSPENWDDSSDGSDNISGKSIMEEALKRMQEGKSAVERDKEVIEQELHGDGETATKERESSNSKKADEEYRKAKDAVGDAIKNAQADKPDDTNSIFDNPDDSFDENSLLGEMGTSSLTSLFKPEVKRDWKVLLERLLDKALGFSIQMNPNLINKRIEDAPPGRESETREIKKVLVIIDCSGSMGSEAFIKVINQIDAMMGAKRDLNKAMFQIVGFGNNSMDYVLQREKRCKGKQFKNTIMSGFEAGGATYILPAIQRCVIKYRNFDAVLIFTDGDIHDGDKCSKSPESLKFFKKYRDRVVWVLTEKTYISTVKVIDPYSIKKKQYVVFRGRGQ